MAVKAFGVALKLSFEGNNQLTNPSTYFYGIVVAISAVTQMNYFNKALDVYSTNLVTPVYYVLFTTATIIASLVMFQGFHDSSYKDMLSVFAGFTTIFIGVFMLNSKSSSDKQQGTIAMVDRQRTGIVSGSMNHFDEENRPFTLRSEDDQDED
jgi:hypothetical protein